jgi:hypothetical protein
MNIGGSLGLIGLGAILAFAVTANTSVFNVHTAGYVIMLVGIAGLVIGLRRRDRGGRGEWVGGRVLVRRVRSRPGSQGAVGSHVTRNPIRAGLPRGDGAAKTEAATTEQATARDIEVIEHVYEQ